MMSVCVQCVCVMLCALKRMLESVICDTFAFHVFMCYNESEQFQSKTFLILFSVIFNTNVSRTNKVMI